MACSKEKIIDFQSRWLLIKHCDVNWTLLYKVVFSFTTGKKWEETWRVNWKRHVLFAGIEIQSKGLENQRHCFPTNNAWAKLILNITETLCETSNLKQKENLISSWQTFSFSINFTLDFKDIRFGLPKIYKDSKVNHKEPIFTLANILIFFRNFAGVSFHFIYIMKTFFYFLSWRAQIFTRRPIDLLKVDHSKELKIPHE